jgi:MerR family transcriptional regulator, thiopeptide resistance regulator
VCGNVLTVGQLAKRCGLSRATLLYYEREGLLRPSVRAANGYRYYGDAEVERIRRIAGYRSYGVSIADIRDLLGRESSGATEQVLRKRFGQLDREIATLRQQQSALVAILERADLRPQQAMTKERWTEIMRAAGMSDEDMLQWHREFEAREPRAHQEFLESLNLSAGEVNRIRAWSRGDP